MYYEYGGEGAQLSGIVASLLSTIGCAFGVVAVVYILVKNHERDGYDDDLVWLAGHRAKELIEHGTEHQSPVRTRRQFFVFLVVSSMPVLFVNFVMLVYIVVIFAAFKAYSGNLWKVFVVVLAMVVKVAGNKMVSSAFPPLLFSVVHFRQTV